MSKIKLVAVSYLNTKPFIYGINKSGILEKDFELQLEHPAKCAEKLKHNEADIGLVPVAIIPELSNPVIVGDYCISCDGAVESVMLFSNVSLKNIRVIYLDYQSKTSAQLIQILAREHWKISPQFIHASPGYEKKIAESTAGLVIGDRAFELKNKFKFAYDLGQEWKQFTGLPFVFACWVANTLVKTQLLDQLNKALFMGVNRLPDVVGELKTHNILHLDTEKYLQQNIHFTMDAGKKEGLNTFLNYLSTPIINL